MNEIRWWVIEYMGELCLLIGDLKEFLKVDETVKTREINHTYHETTRKIVAKFGLLGDCSVLFFSLELKLQLVQSKIFPITWATTKHAKAATPYPNAWLPGK